MSQQSNLRDMLQAGHIPPVVMSSANIQNHDVAAKMFGESSNVLMQQATASAPPAAFCACEKVHRSAVPARSDSQHAFTVTFMGFDRQP
jgi:hypothetical protein